MAFAQNNRNTTISVLLMVILAVFLAAFIFYIIASNQKYFEDKYSLYMFLPNVEGLVPGAFITLSGLKVGVVGDMQFVTQEEQQGIRVELKIDKDYANRITTSSVAMVKTMGILGDKYVDITLGDLNEPPLEAGTFIASRSSPDANVVFADAAEAIRELRNVLTNTDTLTSLALEGKGVVGKILVDKNVQHGFLTIVENLRRTTTQIARGEGNIGKFLQDTTLYSSLSKSSQHFHAILDSLHTGRGTFAQMISDPTFYPRIKSIAFQTDSLLYHLQHEGSAAQLLKDRTFYDNLVNLTRSLDSLSIDMKRHPGRYVKFSLF
ncbi:MAG: MCE family protein [Calditrichaeota bacterium]|nr:MAG: MCE family protein [Calditrichota bacterium]